MAKAATREATVLVCPVCFSDRLDTISIRMSKCESCGFIWNHEVSDRDNLLLIVEHQNKMELARSTPALQVITPVKQKSGKGKKKRG